MNEGSLGTQLGVPSDDARPYFLQLPPPLFRARQEVENGLALLPSALAPGRLALRPTRKVQLGDLLFNVDAHAGWFNTEAEAQREGCDLEGSLFWCEEFLRDSLGGRLSARRILVAEPAKHLWPHLHILPMGSDSQCAPNCEVRENFSKGAHPTSISVIAACDLEPFEQELFVRVTFTPWGPARNRQQRDAQEMPTSGGEVVQQVKRRRQGSCSNAGAEEEAGAEGKEGEEDEDEQKESESGQQVEGPRAQPHPQLASTNATSSDGSGEGNGSNDACAGDSREDPSGAQHSEGIRSSERTRASGTKMNCEVEGLDMIWRNGQAELHLPAGTPDEASMQIPANTRLCLVGSIEIAGRGGDQSLTPIHDASAVPEGYGGPVFPFELNAKSMIVTDDAAKPLKLVRWWDDLPRVSASDNAEAVWWHKAALNDGNFTITTIANPPVVIFQNNSHPMHLATGFKTLWSLKLNEKTKVYHPYQLYVYTTKKCVVSNSSSVCVYSSSLPAGQGSSRKRTRGTQGAPKRSKKRMPQKSDSRSGGESD